MYLFNMTGIVLTDRGLKLAQSAVQQLRESKIDTPAEVTLESRSKTTNTPVRFKAQINAQGVIRL